MADAAVQLLLSGSEAQLQLGEFQISSGRTQLEAGKTQLEAAQEEYDSAREEALKNANLDQLLNMATLTQLIAAQNFSMPAGYIDGGAGDDNRYIIKVGDAFADTDELKNMVPTTPTPRWTKTARYCCLSTRARRPPPPPSPTRPTPPWKK